MAETNIVRINAASTDAKGVIQPMTVEVEITKGIGIHVVGIADYIVKEMLMRVLTAIRSQGFAIPGKRIVINVAPANMYKRGTNLDLPIAIGIMQAAGYIEVDSAILDRCLFSGELGLDGTLREGVQYQGYALSVAASYLLGQHPFSLLTCKESAMQAIPNVNVFSYGFTNLADLLKVLQGQTEATPYLVWRSELWDYVRNGVNKMRRRNNYPL